jgi:hypothetical protein
VSILFSSTATSEQSGGRGGTRVSTAGAEAGREKRSHLGVREGNPLIDWKKKHCSRTWRHRSLSWPGHRVVCSAACSRSCKIGSWGSRGRPSQPRLTSPVLNPSRHARTLLLGSCRWICMHRSRSATIDRAIKLSSYSFLSLVAAKTTRPRAEDVSSRLPSRPLINASPRMLAGQQKSRG